MNPHSRGNCKQEEYRDVGPIYIGPDTDMWRALCSNEEGRAASVRLDECPPSGGHYAATQRCDSCGARFLYGEVLVHVPTDATIVVGWECAAGVFGFAARSHYEAHKLARRAELARKVEEFLAAHPGLREALEVHVNIVQDVGGKLRKYGALSERQVALVLRIAAEEAARAAEVRAPVVAGTAVELRGVILGTRVEETGFGKCVKMLFRDDRGFKVWCTRPAGASDADKGMRLSFVADVEASEKDPCFGFARRPRKCEVIE